MNDLCDFMALPMGQRLAEEHEFLSGMWREYGRAPLVRDALGRIAISAATPVTRRRWEVEPAVAREADTKAERIRAPIASSPPGRYVLNVVPPLEEMEYCEKHDLHRNPKSLRYCWMCREGDKASA